MADGDVEPTGDPFDTKAAGWDDDPKKWERARRVAQCLRAAVDLRADTRLFEYGAGTGMLSSELRDEVGSVTVADRSAGMLEVLRAKAAAGGSLEGAQVLDLDVLRDPLLSERFDLVATVMTLHHIPEIDQVVAALASLLDSGGHLAAADLEAEDGSFHDDEFDGHDGFEREHLRSLLTGAGLVDVAFGSCGVVEKHGRDYPLFLVTARKP